MPTCVIKLVKIKFKDKEMENKEVIITDIEMPFLSMVVFMIKWVLASIPAFIILFLLGTLALGIFGLLTNGMRGY